MVEKELEAELHMNGRVHLPPGVLVYTVEGPLFFGAAETFERVLAQTHSDPGTLITRLKRVPFMDITGLRRRSDEQAFVVPAHAQMNHLPLAAVLLLVA
ncbi:STAS domain-containing protein [Pseudomonas sp. LT1P18]|uniref:STAS domain-containing protein n=1 Tax=Pseudomonas arabinosi TaxID=3398357 RepID=UPI0039EE66B9